MSVTEKRDKLLAELAPLFILYKIQYNRTYCHAMPCMCNNCCFIFKSVSERERETKTERERERVDCKSFLLIPMPTVQ